MNQIFVLICALTLSNAAPKLVPPSSRLFDTPHVFLTLSSEAGVASGIYEDTQFELNWYSFTSAGEGWDRVSLYDQDPALNSSSLPWASTTVNSSSVGRGYFKTNVRFGHPPITSEDELQIDNCLGYWIAYHRNSTLLASNCFRKYPRWMSNLRDVIGNRPLSTLMIPGNLL